jgi:hypothetical protein
MGVTVPFPADHQTHGGPFSPNFYHRFCLDYVARGSILSIGKNICNLFLFSFLLLLLPIGDVIVVYNPLYASFIVGDRFGRKQGKRRQKVCKRLSIAGWRRNV